METKEKSQTEFILVHDIEWIDQFVDKKRKSWILSVTETLKQISNTHKLPTIEVRSKNCGSTFSTAFLVKAIKLFKEQLKQHPEKFANGRIKRYL